MAIPLLMIIMILKQISNFLMMTTNKTLRFKKNCDGFDPLIIIQITAILILSIVSIFLPIYYNWSNCFNGTVNCSIVVYLAFGNRIISYTILTLLSKMLSNCYQEFLVIQIVFLIADAFMNIMVQANIIMLPITLTNKLMHSLNGNIVERKQNVVPLLDSKNNAKILTSIGNAFDRDFTLKPEGFEVNHKVSWPPGDRILTSLTDYFSKTKTQEVTDAESFYSAHSNSFAELMSKSKPVVIAIVLLCAILLFLHKPSSVTRAFLISAIGILMFANYAFDDLKDFKTVDLIKMLNSIPREEDLQMECLQPESFNTTLPVISTVALVCVSIISGFKARKSIFEGLLTASRINETQVLNVSTLLVFVSTSICTYLSSINKEDFAKYFYIDQANDLRVLHFQKEVIEFFSTFNSGNIESLHYCGDLHKTLLVEGQDLSKKVDKNSYETKILADCLNKLTTIGVKLADMQLSMSGERVEPVGVLFKGAPGCMKGVLNKRIAKVIANATLPKLWKTAFKERPEDFFFDIPTDRFWDTYTNKKWISIYDDVFQRRDAVADADADALKIMKMLNSAPYTLTMAEVNSKNNTFFRSAFVFATSNIGNWAQIQSITSWQAARRRFHIEVDVTVNPRYLNLETKKLNFDSLPNLLFTEDGSIDEISGSSIPNDFWLFSVVQKTADAVKDVKCDSLADLCKLIHEKHIQHNRNYLVNRESERRLIAELENFLEEKPKILKTQGFSRNDPRNYLIDQLIETPNYLEYVNSRYYSFCYKRNITDDYSGDMLRALHRMSENWEFEMLREKLDRGVETFMTFFENRYLYYHNGHLNPITHEFETWRALQSTNNDPWTKFIDTLEDVFDLVKANWFTIGLAVLLGGGAIFLLSKFFEKLFLNPESIDYQKMGNKRPKNIVKLSTLKVSKVLQPEGFELRSFKVAGLPKFTSEDFGERNNKTDTIAKLYNKTYFLMYAICHDENADDEHEVLRMGHALNIRANVFLIPFHFIHMIIGKVEKEKIDMTIVFSNTSGSNVFSLSCYDFINSFKTTYDAANCDLCLVKIPSAQRMAKGCFDSIVKQKDMDNLRRSTAFNGHMTGSTVKKTEHGNIPILRNERMRVNTFPNEMAVTASWEEGDSFAYKLSDSFTYRASTTFGDCGSLILTEDGNFENRIITAIHVAGANGYGTATPLTQELVQQMLDECFPDLEYFKEEEKPDYFDEIVINEPQCSMIPSFKIKSSHVPGELLKSQITRSKFFGKLHTPFNLVSHYPARSKSYINDDGLVIDPLDMSFQKYKRTTTCIPYELVQEACQSYFSLIHNKSVSTVESRDVLSVEEALHCFGNINSIASSTSPGFPMCLPFEDNLKDNYYNAMHNKDFEKAKRALERITTLVRRAESLMNERIRLMWVYKQCGKDEILSMLKIAAGKVRLFAGSPFIMLVLFRMYFGRFMDEYVGLNIDVGSAIGVNPYSGAWDAMSRKLQQFNDNSEEEGDIAGDYSEFDADHKPIVDNEISDNINVWYGSEKKNANFIRSCLFVEITNSRHVFRGQVYIWNSGLPSGNPLTAIINTIFNNVMFRIAWGVAGIPISIFNLKVYIVCLGDDHVANISKEFREDFNEMRLPHLMAQIGMTYTTETKGKAEKPMRRLSDIEFLKRGFRHDITLNRWVAPLREASIAAMLNWTKKGKDGDQIAVDNAIFAMRESSLHGKQCFEMWRESLTKLLQRFYSGVEPHGERPSSFEVTYRNVLKSDYSY